MVYKIYISTHQHNEMYLAAVQRALFSINELALSAVTAQDIPVLGNKRHMTAKTMIRESEVFIGLYDATYGSIPTGETQSHEEIEYQMAIELEKPALVFILQGSLQQADERQAEFLNHIITRQVVIYFEDATDLVAKVKIAIDKYRATKPHRRKLVPPPPSFTEGLPPLPTRTPPDNMSEEEFEDWVNQALTIAQNEIQQIVRRALELHTAQQQVNEPNLEDLDNKITVSPLWGEPIRRSQFQSDIFMVMPFREEYTAVFENVIRPVTAELNLTIKRGDEFNSTRASIMQEVWAALNACKLVIVETSAINANVYYELGIAHTLGKPTILLTQTKNVEDLPFDIRHLRFLVYEDTIEGSADLEKRLRNSIIWLLNDLEEQSLDI